MIILVLLFLYFLFCRGTPSPSSILSLLSSNIPLANALVFQVPSSTPMLVTLQSVTAAWIPRLDSSPFLPQHTTIFSNLTHPKLPSSSPLNRTLFPHLSMITSSDSSSPQISPSPSPNIQFTAKSFCFSFNFTLIHSFPCIPTASTIQAIFTRTNHYPPS